MAISEHHAEINGGHGRWLEAGAGWPLVLLHAFPLSADMWRPQLERVPSGWRFIAPDLRGFGPATDPSGSGPPPRADSIDEYARDVRTLMDVLHIDDATIGGLSMGGYVALAMFRLAPQRFSGIVLADTRADADTPEAREGRVKMRTRLSESGVSAIADQMLPRLLSEATRRDDPALVAHVRSLIEANAADALDAALAAMMGRPDATPDLPRISCPALVIVGEADEVTPPALAHAMHAALPRALETLIPGAGHLSSLERPDAFSTALHDFLLAHL
jgi:3-oxoadipate enol-lactonase